MRTNRERQPLRVGTTIDIGLVKMIDGRIHGSNGDRWPVWADGVDQRSALSEDRPVPPLGRGNGTALFGLTAPAPPGTRRAKAAKPAWEVARIYVKHLDRAVLLLVQEMNTSQVS